MRGFTLIELLVATGILTLITGLLLANNSRFGGVILLENLAHDVALSIRQAQVYGISVRSFGTGPAAFDYGYGMHFDVGDPTHYELFADISGDGFFNTNENVPPSPYTIERGYRIAKLCAPAGADIGTCSSVTRLDILFQRPEPDAYIRANGEGALNESARIVLESPRGDLRSVVVEITGQISTE